MYKVVKKSEGTVRKIGDNKTALNLITRSITPDVSLVVIEAKDYHEIETTPYSRIYYVTEGELTLSFDKNEQTLNTGDACFIDKGTTYEMSGTFIALTINQPAFGT